MVEIEIKLRVRDLKSTRERLAALGATLVRERHLEENVLYDFAAGDLRRAHRAVRLRQAGRRATLTYKGPPEKSRSFKVREEFETGVADAGQMRKILRELGLRPAFSYSKHRTLWKKGTLRIALDETSVGDFLELEGERHVITRFARSLGYGRADFIRQTYVKLIGKSGPADGG